MKAAGTTPRSANGGTPGWTLTELLVGIAVLLLIAAILLPFLEASKRTSNKLGCIYRLMQVGIAFRMWGDDQGDKFPMQVSATNGGVMESGLTADAAAYFRVMSNILDNPAILICPNDTNHFPADNFETLSKSNVSYFVNLDAVETQPQMVLSGDGNLMANGKRVLSGILNLNTSDTLAWSNDRHHSTGNILMVDGSVHQTSSEQLTSAARLGTNRLAIP